MYSNKINWKVGRACTVKILKCEINFAMTIACTNQNVA